MVIRETQCEFMKRFKWGHFGETPEEQRHSEPPLLGVILSER